MNALMYLYSVNRNELAPTLIASWISATCVIIWNTNSTNPTSASVAPQQNSPQRQSTCLLFVGRTPIETLSLILKNSLKPTNPTLPTHSAFTGLWLIRDSQEYITFPVDKTQWDQHWTEIRHTRTTPHHPPRASPTNSPCWKPQAKWRLSKRV